MEQERVLIECQPETIKRMKDDPAFLIQYVEGYLENNSDATHTRMSDNAEPDLIRTCPPRLEDMLNDIKKIKRKLKKLKVEQERIAEENDEQYKQLNKSLIKNLKRIENLTGQMAATSNNKVKDSVVVIYEENEWIRKLRDWQKGSM